MQLTLIGPTCDGGFDVHKRGCRDVRQAKYAQDQKHHEEHDTLRSIVDGTYGPSAGGFYVEWWGEGNVPDDAWKEYVGEFVIFPCVGHLPDE